jgi:hypothetical protein
MISKCCYEKEGDKARCKPGVGQECATWIKSEIKKRGLKGKVWATRSLCQGYCDKDGTSVTYVKSKGKPLKQYSAMTFDEFVEKTNHFLKDV